MPEVAPGIVLAMVPAMVKVTMLLAQAPGQPQGNLDDKLEMQLELTAGGQIDLAAHQAAPSPWLALRERPGQMPRQSELIRLDENWALQSMRSEDDPLWTFEVGVIRPGELVRLGRPGGEEQLFRIVSVEGD